MKKNILFSMLIIICMQSNGQMIMSAEGVNPDNVCKPNEVYFLMENRAKPTENIDSIEIRLNYSIKYANENPSFESQPAIQFAVNCNGEIGGGFHVVTKSGNENLNQELIEFFKTIKSWKTGKIKKKTVDSWYMWRLKINNGYIDII